MYVKALALTEYVPVEASVAFFSVIIIFISCLLVKNLLTSKTFLIYYWLLT
jgi:hypothetical protein